MAGVAVKVTDAPLQMVAVDGVIDTDGTVLPTVTAASLEVAVFGLAHASLLVITTVTF